MEKVSDSKGEMMMDLFIKEISIENEKINRDKFFSVGFCPEIERYLLCVHISWVVGYDRYYAIDAEDIMLYEESPDEFCQKYEYLITDVNVLNKYNVMKLERSK